MRTAGSLTSVDLQRLIRHGDTEGVLTGVHHHDGYTALYLDPKTLRDPGEDDAGQSGEPFEVNSLSEIEVV